MIVNLAGSSARTASGSSGSVGSLEEQNALRIQLNVTAAAGIAPSLAVLLEDSLDGTNWNAIGTFAAKTAAGREVINVTTLFSGTVRASWTITGTTPSFTFSILAHAE